MKMERYVIYNAVTGFCENGQTGLVDRAETHESSMAEHVKRLLVKYGPDAAVTYFPENTKFDRDKQKVVDGKIVAMDAADLAAVEAARPKTLDERVTALEKAVAALAAK